MNERIRQLVEKAPYTTVSTEGRLFSQQDLAKFAELLVRQCIKSTLSLRDTAIDNEWNLDETFHMIVDTIVEDLDMQHIFRVEE
jgi:hypothetical protein